MTLPAAWDPWVSCPAEGVTYPGLPCIKIFVDRPQPELTAKIPSTLDGYRIIVEAIGEIRTLDSE